MLSLLDSFDYHMRKELESTLIYSSKKIIAILRYNQPLQHKVTALLRNSEKNGYSLNRIFYQLLTDYAKNLNQNPDLLLQNRKLLESFASCPTPHLPFARKKPYTLVASFEGTLALPKTQNNRVPLKLRPHSTHFISSLARYYEVVIFTYLMPEDFEEEVPFF